MLEKKYYKPIEIARLYSIHPNTVRLYEKLHYISPAERDKNNYRRYTKIHILQFKICRCIFGYPFFNKKIREAGNKTIWAIADKLYNEGLILVENYIELIKLEIKLAEDTKDIVKRWLNNEIREFDENRSMSRKEASMFFGVTIEAIRNWERNGLINSNKKGEKGEVLYSGDNLERLKIVYMLRQAGYSMSAIYRSLSIISKDNVEDVLTSLENPNVNEVISVGDRWLFELKKLLESAYKIPDIINEIKEL